MDFLTKNKFLNLTVERNDRPATIHDRNWRLLEYFNFYRLIVAATAASIAISGAQLPLIGETNPRLFLVSGLFYVFISGVAITTIHNRKPDFMHQTATLAFADAIILVLLMHASGGITSGIGLLLLVSVVGSSLILDQRLTIFFASLAAIGILLEQSWGFLKAFTTTPISGEIGISPATIRGLPQAGLLGAALFAAGFLTNNLSRRLRATEELAESRGERLASMAHINELVIQRLVSGIVVCDAMGIIHMINQPARNFLGMTEKSKDQMLLSESAPDLATLLFAWLDKPSSARPNILDLPSGYSVQPRLVLLGEGEDSGILIFLEDIAVLKQQAQQVKMAALARLTSGIAHEIRNPLGAIRNAAQLLGEDDKHNKEDLRLIEIINNHCRRMNSIIENITQLGRSDHANPERLVLQSWLQDFVEQYLLASQLPSGAIELELSIGLKACMDPNQLYQIVNNLCNNAIRHSLEFSGERIIRFKTGNDDREKPYLDIIDWGDGIPEDIREHIFEPFYTSTKQGGTGLGLYIARELCESNGSRLDCYPGNDGVGTRFRITFARADMCN